MKDRVISIAISVLFSVTAVAVYHYCFKERTVFIRSGAVLQQYKGMEQANKQFEKDMQVVQANYDTLKNRYERLLAEEKYVPSSGKADWGYKLGVAKNDFDKYNTQATQQMEARKQELTQGVLLKINTFIQEFGKKNNYKMILGTTNEGSVLYGRETDDMTEVVLKSLNEEYEHSTQEQKKDR